MRPISINKLKAIIGQWYSNRYSETFKFPTEIPITDLKELIESTPIVEAISINWIRDYMLRLPDGSEAYECILVMLEDWEKENETDRCR